MKGTLRFWVSVAASCVVVGAFAKLTGCWHPSVLLLIAVPSFAVIAMIAGVD